MGDLGWSRHIAAQEEAEEWASMERIIAAGLSDDQIVVAFRELAGVGDESALRRFIAKVRGGSANP